MYKKLYFLTFFFPLLLFSQPQLVNGVVLNKSTKSPISSINIYLKGANIGTVSDSQGRFSILIKDTLSLIVFDHIGFHSKELTTASLMRNKIFYLVPRVIPLTELHVEEQKISRNFQDGLFQPISGIEKTSFKLRGYVDPGDLLKTEHSIHVGESISGQKGVSLRGGNQQETLVLFNGIKLTNTYAGNFDISLIPLEDIERIEIIKGSHSSLFGSGAVSGVINIIPNRKPTRAFRVHQRLGTYNSGDWGIRLHRHNNKLSGTYSFREYGTSRKVIHESETDVFLSTSGVNHLAFLSGESKKYGTTNLFGIASSSIFHNPGQDETIRNIHELLNVDWSNRWLDVSLGRQNLVKDESLIFNQLLRKRRIENETLTANIKTRYKRPLFEQILSMQLESSDLGLQDSLVNQINMETFGGNLNFSDVRAGIVSVIKMQNSALTDSSASTHAHLSFRYDTATLNRSDSTNTSHLMNDAFTWNLSSNFTGENGQLSWTMFMNYGTTVRFPSVLQQISRPFSDSTTTSLTIMTPEKLKGLALGIMLSGQALNIPEIKTHRASVNLFYNRYINKIRMFYPAGYPIPFYDVIPDTKLSGIEAELSVLFPRNNFRITTGLSKYFIPEKAAFPYKSELKITGNVTGTVFGWTIGTFVFYESEQVGWARSETGEISEIILPDYNNLDLNVGKEFHLWGLDILVNISIRNLLEDNDILTGFSFRDRRYYLTGSVRY